MIQLGSGPFCIIFDDVYKNKGSESASEPFILKTVQKGSDPNCIICLRGSLRSGS